MRYYPVNDGRDQLVIDTFYFNWVPILLEDDLTVKKGQKNKINEINIIKRITNIVPFINITSLINY